MVGLTRIELVTSSLSGTRSNQLSYKPLVAAPGGGSRIRTGDILLAKQALYQLSHAPYWGARYSPSGRGAEHFETSLRGLQLAPRGGVSSERR